MSDRKVIDIRPGFFGAVLIAFSMVFGFGRPANAAGSCEGLASVALASVKVTVAQTVPAGGFTPEGGGQQTAAMKSLPSFCRVAATLTPSADSDIKIELWMPVANWNGKLMSVGNGAFSGDIAYPALASALARGYAAASTDTGHSGNTAKWAIGHPEKVIDFGWRAVHEMTTTSKALVAKYYDSGPRYSYWNGCSAGGRQALKEAQRFPSDYDGIIAGAPGLDWTGRAAQAVRVAKVLEPAESARLTDTDRQLLHRAVVDACDALDGLKDGLIAKPERCTFDPGVLECRAGTSGGCLTHAQVETARLIYSGAPNPKTKREIPGLARGSELGWTDLGWTASARATGLDQFRYIVFGEPNWTVQQFDFASNIARAEDVDGGTINALDPNLKPFIDHGKLIQYHGWADPQISSDNSTQYYQRVLDALGGTARVQGSYRLFMAPGMGHCAGGEGPNTFDMVGALEQWVEHGKAPDQIIASHATAGTVDRTRPLCPYPQIAVYRGSGNMDEAANFVCKAE
jgi:feruloyl esterase